MEGNQPIEEKPVKQDGIEAESPQKRKIPKIVLMAGIITALFAFQAFTSHILVKQIFFSAPEPRKATSGSSTTSKNKEKVGEFYMINDLIINPSATGGRRHLLVSLGLEYGNPKLGEELSKRDPQIRDNLMTLLASQEVNILTDIRYRENIRKALLKAVNYYLPEGEVDRLYFVKYVFQ